MKKSCRAFPANQTYDESVREWCRMNKHNAMCKGCRLSDSEIPEKSLWQVGHEKKAE